MELGRVHVIDGLREELLCPDLPDDTVDRRRGPPELLRQTPHRHATAELLVDVLLLLRRKRSDGCGKHGSLRMLLVELLNGVPDRLVRPPETAGQKTSHVCRANTMPREPPALFDDLFALLRRQ